MKQRKIHILPFPVMATIILIVIAFMSSFYLFTVIYEPIRNAFLTEHIFLFVIWTLCACGLSFLILVMLAKPMFSIIQIDENGITRAFLGRFWKLHISWEEIAEARYYVRVSEQMIFSKTQKLGGIPILKWHKLKDVIFMGFSKRRYNFIKQYMQQSIVGIPKKLNERLNKTDKE